MKTISLAATSLLLIFSTCLVSFTDSCSPEGWRPLTTIQEIGFSPVILYGKVLETTPHQSYDTAYNAKMEVYCILKGGRVRRIVTIRNAGYMPGMCTATELLPGGVYLVPVMEDLQATGVSFKDPAQIEEALKACNLNPPTYPMGVSATSAVVQCPAGLPASQCQNQ